MFSLISSHIKYAPEHLLEWPLHIKDAVYDLDQTLQGDELNGFTRDELKDCLKKPYWVSLLLKKKLRLMMEDVRGLYVFLAFPRYRLQP